MKMWTNHEFSLPPCTVCVAKAWCNWFLSAECVRKLRLVLSSRREGCETTIYLYEFTQLFLHHCYFLWLAVNKHLIEGCGLEEQWESVLINGRCDSEPFYAQQKQRKTEYFILNHLALCYLGKDDREWGCGTGRSRLDNISSWDVESHSYRPQLLSKNLKTSVSHVVALKHSINMNMDVVVYIDQIPKTLSCWWKYSNLD